MPQAHNTFWWWLIGLIVVAHIAAFLFLRGKSGVYQPNVPAMDPPLELARSRLTNGNWNGGPVEPIPQAANDDWKERALAAEKRAQNANAVVKSGLIPHLANLMRNKLVGMLVSQREYLLETQQHATFQVALLEERLAKIQEQLNHRLSSYERRILELESELAAKEAQNRALLHHTIHAQAHPVEGREFPKSSPSKQAR
jgi:hypothetical protein